MSATGSGHSAGAPPAGDGILVVDKPAGWTSHDVVARVRRLAGTRRVGHAGTLDPMATGVLVVGVGRATRLLGHLALRDKEYFATVRLGSTTTTDDADGEVLSVSAQPWDVVGVRAAMASLTGAVEQIPSAVSAVKVHGVRAYARVRAGESVELAARRVVVSRFDLLAVRGQPAELDVRVECSTGTYVRALARDLGGLLGTGAHLAALRRTRVGPFGVADARTLDELADHFRLTPLGDAVAAAFPRCGVDAGTAAALRYGRPVPSAEVAASGQASVDPCGPLAAFGPSGEVIALVERRGGVARPLIVFAPG